MYKRVNWEFIFAEKQPSDIETTNAAERFSCEYCEKTFAHKSGLNTHLKTHRGNDSHLFSNDIDCFINSWTAHMIIWWSTSKISNSDLLYFID